MATKKKPTKPAVHSDSVTRIINKLRRDLGDEINDLLHDVESLAERLKAAEAFIDAMQEREPHPVTLPQTALAILCAMITRAHPDDDITVEYARSAAKLARELHVELIKANSFPPQSETEPADATEG